MNRRMLVFIGAMGTGLVFIGILSLFLTEGFFADFLLDRNSKFMPYPVTVQNIMWVVFFIGAIDKANNMFNSSLELFQHEVELRYNTLRYIVWLIPTLGFIGTVVGIALALSDAGSVENYLGYDARTVLAGSYHGAERDPKTRVYRPGKTERGGPSAAPDAGARDTQSPAMDDPPVGWLVVIQGDRGYQEDDFSIRLLTGGEDLPDEDRLLLVLADGMGGHAGGAVASKTVVQAFQDAFHRNADTIADRFNAGINAANSAVKEKQRADPALSEMGATLVAALVIGPSLYWTSVGDSILWLFREDRLHRLNADHSMRPLLQYLVELGRLTEEEASNDPRMHQLRSVIYGESIPRRDCPRRAHGV